MKTVFHILADDIRSITKSFFVILIIGGICILPALYAWINIYANYDPYENTGNIPIAVAGNDKGIQHKGKHINAVDDIVKDLKTSKKIGWIFPATADDAIQGVRAGNYYAAIIFEDGFTYEMYNFTKAIADPKPSVTYYTNTKKNAVASKISDTAAENLLDSINNQYLKSIFLGFFEDSSAIADKLDDSNAVNTILAQLIGTRNALSDFDDSARLFSRSSAAIKDSLKGAEKGLNDTRKNSKSDIDAAKQNYQHAKKTIDAIKSILEKRMKKLKSRIKTLEDAAEKAKNLADKDKAAETKAELVKLTEHILTVLEDIRKEIPDNPKTSGAKAVAETLDIMISENRELLKTLNDLPWSLKAASSIIQHTKDLDKMLNDDFKPAFSLMISDINNALKQMKPLLDATDEVLDDTAPVLRSAKDAMSSLDTSLLQLEKTLQHLEDKLDDLISKVNDADDNEKKELLIRFLGGDPEKYSSFISDLVNMDVKKVYTVRSYGAAMTPFYSVLAIWVGGVMMASLFNTRVNRRKYPRITESRAFFGRSLIFLLVGQLQAAIIVAGDILLLGVSPVHPGMMFFAASVTSAVFSVLIYSLVLAFGDAGKALVVVIMVLQISGSSGSYPIEILPPIYAKIYTFFPFPYAINAIREAMCGAYGYDYLVYLAQLLVFGGIGITIGLVIRRPFIGVSEFMNEKLEETEVL